MKSLSKIAPTYQSLLNISLRLANTYVYNIGIFRLIYNIIDLLKMIPAQMDFFLFLLAPPYCSQLTKQS